MQGSEPLSASTAVAKEQSTLTHLRGLLEVTSLVRGEDDLDAVLEAIARTIAECLGFGTVAVNLYRPAWDDFQVTNVYGNPGAREALLGDARGLASWQPLLDERFLRRGAYLIPHELFDWAADVATFVPDIEPTDDPDAWHPEDALMVPMRHTAGHLLGILSVDEPRSGRKPTDEELDVLVAVAEHAALAVESAQAAADAARHQAALEQLLRVSSRLSETLDAREIFQSVCESVRDALGFQHVAIELVEPATGRLCARAAVGWSLGEHVQELRSLADHAPLTRLLNRRVFMERLDSEAARADRSGSPFGLVLCDLDRFKLLNDSQGHLAGDQALQTLGRILLESVRRSDEAFRIGGDEFALVLPDADPDAIESVVERITRAMDGALDSVRASFGAASYPSDAGHPEALVQAADAALYDAKRAGERLRFAA